MKCLEIEAGKSQNMLSIETVEREHNSIITARYETPNKQLKIHDHPSHFNLLNLA